MDDNGKIVAELQLKLDAKTSAPKFVETSGFDWVPYKSGDGKDEYPNKLIDFSMNSALHGAIISSKIDQVAGNGFTYDTSSLKSEATRIFLEQNKINSEWLRKVSSDLIIFNGISSIVEWSKDWNKITKVEHIDFSKMRSEKVNPETGKIDKYYYCWDWELTSKYPVVPIPTFDLDEKIRNQDILTKEQYEKLNVKVLTDLTKIKYFHPYQPNYFYYPLPDYQGGMNAIETDIFSDQYGLKSFKNGMSSDYVITFIGNISDAQFKKECRAFIEMNTGSKSTGLPIFTRAKNKDEAIQIDKIPAPEKDERYSNINENVQSKILAAHKITSPLLVGVKTAGQLGGSEELKEAGRLFFINVIKPKQLEILNFINEIMNINDLEQLSIKSLDIYGETSNTI